MRSKFDFERGKPADGNKGGLGALPPGRARARRPRQRWPKPAGAAPAAGRPGRPRARRRPAWTSPRPPPAGLDVPAPAAVRQSLRRRGEGVGFLRTRLAPARGSRRGGASPAA